MDNERVARPDVVLEARSLRKFFPTGASKMLQRPTDLVQAVDDVSLKVVRGSTLAIVGESGCGKSTLARLLARLIEPTSGTVLLDGADVTGASSKELLKLRRDIQIVFQDPYACLNPRHSIGQSIGTPIRIQKTMSRADEKNRVQELMELVGLNIEHYNRFPHEFSGGQRQRVAMGRAIVRKPQVFLMDEPLSNLDAKLRVQTRTQIASLQRRLGVTTVYVTHDQIEAMTMGDRVAVLKDGVLQQVDTPRALYERPANVFVAGFIGSPAMNLLSAPVSGGKAMLGDLAVDVPASAGASVTVGIRPEGFAPAASGFKVLVEVVEELGADAFVYGKPADSSVNFANSTDEGAQVIVRWDPKNPPKPGDTITVTAAAASVHLFNATTGERLK